MRAQGSTWQWLQQLRARPLRWDSRGGCSSLRFPGKTTLCPGLSWALTQSPRACHCVKVGRRATSRSHSRGSALLGLLGQPWATCPHHAPCRRGTTKPTLFKLLHLGFPSRAASGRSSRTTDTVQLGVLTPRLPPNSPSCSLQLGSVSLFPSDSHATHRILASTLQMRKLC